MLIHFGIKPYLVFDGDYLPSKARTEEGRAARRAESRKIGLELLKLGKTTQAQAELQKAIDVTPEMAKQLIEQLKQANVDYVVAPYEADSQLVYLEQKGFIQGILSEDSDLLVFGAKCLLTKLDQYGDCVMISRSQFTACREVSLVGWSDAEFRQMAILSGCDYLPSINKVGLKTAHRLVRKHKTIDRIIRSIQFDSQFKIPATYLESFRQAELTFLHQWVFCPDLNGLVHLTEHPSGTNSYEMEYLGPYVEPAIALGVARADLHPHTKQPLHCRNDLIAPDKRGPPTSRKRTVSVFSDLKGNKTIESCFKPRRIPLAELDPNSFTPSPSQRGLLRDRPMSWSASAAPIRSLQSSISTGLPTPPVRRAISNTRLDQVAAGQSSKRQRLCSDSNPVLPASASARMESGTSRFFAEAQEDSPTCRKRSDVKKVPKTKFNLWSDDSIEDAMATIPDPNDCSTSERRKALKPLVYVDQATSEAETPTATKSTSVSAAQGKTALHNPPLEESQTTHTPSTKKSQAPVATAASSLNANLSAEFQTLRSRFSFHAFQSSTGKTLESASPSVEHTPPRQQMDDPRPLPDVASDQSSDSLEQDRVEVLASPQRHQLVPPAASPDENSDLGHKDTVCAASESEGETKTPIARATKTSPSSKAQTWLATIRGSEDLLVPDSEGEPDASASEDDGLYHRPRALDLSRFAFIPV